MSFSTSHTNVLTADDIKVETMGTAPTERHLAQFNAGKAVATTLMTSGIVGEGPFVIGISGHAGSEEGPVSSDAVNVNVMKMYPVVQG